MGRNNVLLRKRNLATQSLFSFGAHARPRGRQVRRARAAWLLGNSYFVLGTRTAAFSEEEAAPWPALRTGWPDPAPHAPAPPRRPPQDSDALRVAAVLRRRGRRRGAGNSRAPLNAHGPAASSNFAYWTRGCPSRKQVRGPGHKRPRKARPAARALTLRPGSGRREVPAPRAAPPPPGSSRLRLPRLSRSFSELF